MKKSVIIAGLSVAVGLLVGGASVSANTVTVQQGDTVSKIAADNGTTIQAIASQNNLDNPNLIYVGDKLVVSPQKYSSTEVSVAQPVQSAKISKPIQSTQSTQQSGTATNDKVEFQSGTLSDSEVQTVADQMASRTGQSASYWKAIMWRESNNQVSVTNPSSGSHGLFQSMYTNSNSVQEQIDDAVNLYNKQGTQAWSLN